MDFGQKSTLKGASTIVGSNSGGNVIQQIKVKAPLKDLLPGHVVVIADGLVNKRWDGSNVDVTQSALGIVTAKQFDDGDSVTVLRAGNYLRDRAVLADNSALSAANEFTLSLCNLFVEGAW